MDDTENTSNNNKTITNTSNKNKLDNNNKIADSPIFTQDKPTILIKLVHLPGRKRITLIRNLPTSNTLNNTNKTNKTNTNKNNSNSNSNTNKNNSNLDNSNSIVMVNNLLKQIKKENSCGGTYKKATNELQFQGDCVEKATKRVIEVYGREDYRYMVNGKYI